MKYILKTKQNKTFKFRKPVSWVSPFPAIVPLFGIPNCFLKIIFFFCKRVQEATYKVSVHVAFCILEKWTGPSISLTLCPFPIFTRPRFKSSQNGPLLLWAVSSFAAQERRVINPNVRALLEVGCLLRRQTQLLEDLLLGPASFPTPSCTLCCGSVLSPGSAL